MPDKTIRIKVSEAVYDLLKVLAGETQDVEDVVGILVDHAQQGVYRPHAWQRHWLTRAFPTKHWSHKLEPGDPYGRRGDGSMFRRPVKPA